MPSRSTHAACTIAALLAAACAGNTAPEGMLPTRVEAQSSAYGGWIELTLTAAPNAKSEFVDGELLAVTTDSLWVLTANGGRVIATTAVKEGKLTGYRAQTGDIGKWTTLGVLSTASNGVVLIITAPLWIITGTVAGSNDSHAPITNAPPEHWPDLARFARFPQGMPPGVALSSLKARH